VRNGVLWGCMWASVGRSFLEFHKSHVPRMRLKRCDFGCFLSTKKGSLLGDQNISSAVFRLPFDVLPSEPSCYQLSAHALQTVRPVNNYGKYNWIKRVQVLTTPTHGKY
jgi:hypothetical protein